MIFITVGTQFGFDRLIEAIDKAVSSGLIAEEIFAQIGLGDYKPKNFKYVDMLDKQQFEDKISQADAIISHAGVGSIITALEKSKPMLVMPRLKQYGELVNDHQSATARKFEELGHVLAAYDVGQLPEKIKQLKTFVPKPRTASPEKVAEKIGQFLAEI